MDFRLIALSFPVSLLAAASLTACGGGGDSSPASPTANAAPAPAPAPAAAAAPAPAAAAAPAPAPTALSSSGCFEDFLLAVGNVVVTDYEAQGPLTGGTHTETKLTSLNSTFNGTPGLFETSVVTTGTNFSNGIAFDTNISGKSYGKRVSPGVVASYGGTATTVLFGQSYTSNLTYTPPYVNGTANLLVGETATYSYTGNLTSSGPGSGPITGSTTVKFVGRETITVPAGPFNACRYEEQGSGSFAVSSTTWYYRSFPIKSSVPSGSGTQLIQLKSATINGASI